MSLPLTLAIIRDMAADDDPVAAECDESREVAEYLQAHGQEVAHV